MIRLFACEEHIMTTDTLDSTLLLAAPRAATPRFQRMVLATAGESSCSGALRTASTLARRHQAHVSVISVFHPRIPYPTAAAGSRHRMIPPSERSQARAQLARVREQLAAVGPTTEEWGLSFAAGNVAVNVTAAAKADHADLVIIGLGRPNPAERGLGDRGSMAISASIQAPLLAAAPDFEGTPRHILVAIGRDQSAVRAAEMTRRLFPSPDQISLVHITESAYDESDVASRFEEVREALSEWGGQVDAWTLSGNPIDALLHFVGEHRVDLVVGGLHGDSFDERAIIRNAVMWMMGVGERSVLLVPFAPLRPVPSPAHGPPHADIVHRC
jgi:nucleotide-binding universal stress UspA family protein